jgi:hypothetical protein
VEATAEAERQELHAAEAVRAATEAKSIADALAALRRRSLRSASAAGGAGAPPAPRARPAPLSDYDEDGDLADGGVPDERPASRPTARATAEGADAPTSAADAPEVPFSTAGLIAALEAAAPSTGDAPPPEDADAGLRRLLRLQRDV